MGIFLTGWIGSFLGQGPCLIPSPALALGQGILSPELGILLSSEHSILDVP